MRSLRVGVIAAIGCLVAAGAIGAAIPTSGWTPKQTETLLASPSTKFFGVVANSAGFAYAGAPITRSQSAQCSGSGTETNGLYSTFSCKVGTRTVWVRPWSARSVCATAVSLGSCPPALPTRTLPADPRLCSDPDYAACVRFAANTAIVKAANAAGENTFVNKGCTATSTWTVYTCSWKSGSGTVTFVSAPSGWSVRTTLAG